MKKICFVLTAEFTVRAFLTEHLKKLSDLYEITVVVNTENPNFLQELNVNAKVIPLKIARDIKPWSDLCCLMALIKILFKERFSSVHSITPKAGLLAMLAAYITLVPVRIHTFQGEVWVTRTGFMRYLLITLDKLVANLATHLTIVSPSEKDFLIAHKIINKDKSFVFNKGSIAGVNLTRFGSDDNARQIFRTKYNISANTVVFLYLGRLNLDKGVLDLAHAFSRFKNEDAALIFVGPDEKNMFEMIKKSVSDASLRIFHFDKTDQPELFLASADVICLPSYREGFGVSLIEAAAVGIPSIASRIYGITDAVIENETGLLHTAGDVIEIYQHMQTMLRNKELRLRLGYNANLRVIKDFDSKIITKNWVNFYTQNIKLI